MGFSRCMTYQLVWPSPRALWEKMLIKNGMRRCVERIVRSHEQVIVFISGTSTKIYHELQFRLQFTFACFVGKMHIGTTSEHVKMRNRRFLPLK